MYSMKYKSIEQKLEEAARKHLGVTSLHNSQDGEMHKITVRQLNRALKAAYLAGEQIGYGLGFSNAKLAGDCSLEEIRENENVNVE